MARARNFVVALGLLGLCGGAAWAGSHDEPPPLSRDARAASLVEVARGSRTALDGGTAHLAPRERALVARVRQLHARILAGGPGMSKSETDEVMTEIDIVDEQLANPGEADFDPQPASVDACARACRPSGRTPAARQAARVFCRTACLISRP